MIKKRLTIFCIVAFSISLLLISSTAFSAEKVVKWRFGSASFPGLPTHTWTIKFAEVMKERTNGKYQIEAIQERKLGGTRIT